MWWPQNLTEGKPNKVKGDSKLRTEQEITIPKPKKLSGERKKELLKEGFKGCRAEGKKLPRRLLGILDRETGKLIDQFPALQDRENEVSKVVMSTFLEYLDIELKERGLTLPLEKKEDN